MKNIGLCLPNGEPTTLKAGDHIVYSMNTHVLAIIRHVYGPLLIDGARKADATWITSNQQFEFMAMFMAKMIGCVVRFKSSVGGTRLCEFVLPE